MEVQPAIVVINYEKILEYEDPYVRGDAKVVKPFLWECFLSQNLIHNELIFRLLLKITVN